MFLRLIIFASISILQPPIALSYPLHDRDTYPPEVRVFVSPNLVYKFTINGTHGWKTPHVAGHLMKRNSRGIYKTMWSKDLPQKFGPRLAFLANTGNLIMFDEWMKTPSPFALLIFDQRGRSIAKYSMWEIIRISGVSGPLVATLATEGPWMSSRPVVDKSSHFVYVKSGGRDLVVNLVTGSVERK
jgi:hypothetical protein